MDKLAQIATKAGVSANTVLRVLRGENKEVWPSAVRRAEEIRQLARSLGYMPNSSARAIRRGRFNCIALLLSTDGGRSYLPNDLFNHIHNALNEQGKRLVISRLPDEKLTSTDTLPSILQEWSCDGLLINYTDHIPQEMMNLLGQYEIPSIWINCRQEHDCVYYDDFGGAMAATQHLLRLGHRRITYLDFIGDRKSEPIHYSRADRYAGYAQAMRSAGLTPVEWSRFAGVPVDQRLETTRALLASADRPTALLSYDGGDRLLYAAALASLRVPQDVSLVSFVSRPPLTERPTLGESFLGRNLAAMRIPADKAGRQAVSMLMQKLADHASPSLPPSVIDLEWEPGDTCGPAPR